MAVTGPVGRRLVNLGVLALVERRPGGVESEQGWIASDSTRRSKPRARDLEMGKECREEIGYNKTRC